MGAKNSESCLIEFQNVGEVSEVILISKLEPHLFDFSRYKSKSAQSKL